MLRSLFGLSRLMPSFREYSRWNVFVLVDQQLPLLALLIYLVHSNTLTITDPHDRVYALFGLALRVSGELKAPYRVFSLQYEGSVAGFYLEVVESLVMELPV